MMDVSKNAEKLQKTTTVGACSLVVSAISTGDVVIPEGSKILFPGVSALEYFTYQGRIDLPNPEEVERVEQEAARSTKTVVLKQPKHGRLIWLGDKGNEVHVGFKNSYTYKPRAGYVGTDRVTFVTEIAGHRIKVIYFIRVINKTINTDDYAKLNDKYCPRQSWIIPDEA
jgi:hypothetical protein